jgi:hypothetical protein
LRCGSLGGQCRNKNGGYGKRRAELSEQKHVEFKAGAKRGAILG